MTAHLRMNAVYWGLIALCIMKHKGALDAEETIEYVMSCWDDEAGAYYKSPTYIPPSFTRTRVHSAQTTFKKVPLAHTRDTTHTSFPR